MEHVGARRCFLVCGGSYVMVVYAVSTQLPAAENSGAQVSGGAVVMSGEVTTS